ncbi:DUF1929 domain-containing protein [Alcanivorax sp. IO_7]|nr:DUF1929 domain-containing protein [Alcanivorax sp. IO_7]
MDAAAAINEVLLVRRTSLTHLVDGDQRTVVLPHTVGDGQVSVTIPGNAAVAPAGHYLLFVNRVASDGSAMVVPSTAASVQVRLPDAAPALLARQ